MCNDTCKYSYVNLTSKRIFCLCQPHNYNIETDEETDEEINIPNYILSLINYKIIVCYKLFLDKDNYYYNFGFYISICGFLFCFFAFLIFMKFGLNLLNKQLNDNFPSGTKKEINLRINNIKKKLKKKNKNATNNQNTKIKTKNKESSILIFNNINNILRNNDLLNNPPRNSKKIIILNSYKNDNNKIENKAIFKERTVKIVRKAKRSKSSYNYKKKDPLILNLNNDEKDSERKIIKQDLESEKSNENFLKISNIKNKIKNEKEIINNKSYIIDPLINYNNYIIIDDNSVDKKEINNVPYTQALRIDKRQFFDIYLSVLYMEINAINIFYYKNEHVHLSLTISIYVFSELLDFTINCFLYTDDEISEKYHNNGSLKIITSLSLSFISNIFSNIIVYLISKLTNFSEILEIMIKDIRNPEAYTFNVERIKKYTGIKLSIFYILQFIFIIFIMYYLFIFCAIYKNSQINIMVNYLYGILESLAISLALALITSLTRYISLKYKISRLYNFSKYFYQHF